MVFVIRKVWLLVKDGRKYGVQGSAQPRVTINPGALSQGTVVISLPRGIADPDCTLEIRGGHLKEGVRLPLRVIKAEYKTPDTGKN